MSRDKFWKKWGVLFSGDKITLSEQLKFAADAESAGAESLWSAELWRDGFVPLAAMATVARKVRLGTGVAHFARTPMLTELSAMSMAELSDGRFILGLGTAPKAWNEDWHGLPYHHPVDRMREYIECVRLMWTSSPEHPIQYDGKFYKIRNYRRLNTPPPYRIPIYLAAVLPGMMRLAGSHADGIIVNVLNTPRYFQEVVQPYVKQGLELAGKKPFRMVCGEGLLGEPKPQAGTGVGAQRDRFLQRNSVLRRGPRPCRLQIAKGAHPSAAGGRRCGWCYRCGQ